eukprot:15319167-Alexandrium_andersonii.AAC.1
MSSQRSARGLRPSPKRRALRMGIWKNSLARMLPGLRWRRRAWHKTQRIRSQCSGDGFMPWLAAKTRWLMFARPK